MTWSPAFSDGDAGADLAHDARAFMAEDRREQAFRVGAGQRVGVGVADAGRLDLDQHLAGLRPFDVDGLDRQRFARLPGHRGARFHRYRPPKSRLNAYGCQAGAPSRRRAAVVPPASSMTSSNARNASVTPLRDCADSSSGVLFADALEPRRLLFDIFRRHGVDLRQRNDLGLSARPWP